MKKIVRLITGLACVAALSGCATSAKRVAGSADIMMSGAAADNTAEVRPDRMLIWKAHLSIEVWSVSNAVSEATSMAERQGGFVEQKSDRGEESASVTLRVPAKTFKTALAALETLGTVTYRNVEGEDVTEQYIDVEARLKNKIVLRDRLKQLLEKATDVKDILAIETELNRVQGDIDSMEGRIKSLKGQVEYATVTLSLERKAILGPLGYLFKGLWWGVEKLFVIRE
ncbi:MAG: DUF4349 domain-containing protein [Kiritimatiellaeota bacterium]|nr:DUF4349 domain-containing protein [Kiritimatiellota bacterium]